MLELETIIDMDKPDVICITETKLDPSTGDVTLGLKDYNIWRKDRADGNGGGVAILTKKGIIIKELEINQMEMEGGGSNINKERNCYKGVRN